MEHPRLLLELEQSLQCWQVQQTPLALAMAPVHHCKPRLQPPQLLPSLQPQPRLLLLQLLLLAPLLMLPQAPAQPLLQPPEPPVYW
jgi:hypothetical protein